MTGPTSRGRLRSFLLGSAALAGCSSGGTTTPPVIEDPPPAAFDLAAPSVDLAKPPTVDLARVVLATCTWKDRFKEAYGQAWSGADVAFVTTDNAVARGIDKLDLAAQKTQVPDIVLVKGNRNRIKEIQLLSPDGSKVLASRTGPYIYGLGYAMWLEVNAYGEAGITEATLIRQLGMETPSYQQTVAIFRLLTRTAEAQVTAADRADFQTAAAKLMTAIETEKLTFTMGTGHGADFRQTAQVVNGKTFSFQLSNGYGLDPQLGFQRDGVWGPLWNTFGPTGGWSASAPGMQPKCGGCVQSKSGSTTYQLCDGPLKQAAAASTCASRGGELATVNDVFEDAFLRALSATAGSAYIGLNDLGEQGRYVWPSGKVATYTNWLPGQPDNSMGQEHCVQLYDGKAVARWNDISCATELPYLCQIP